MSTTSVTALTTGYTLATEGTCLIDIKGTGTVRFHVGPSLPAVNTELYFTIRHNEGGFAFSGTESVYVMSNDENDHDCIVGKVE
ncbi:MAG: hypothetical protein GY820_38410 [Gammaproteobacteria bacterium]|nr:hypothetical protein [Gammaproteobacteria bacterium]